MKRTSFQTADRFCRSLLLRIAAVCSFIPFSCKNAVVRSFRFFSVFRQSVYLKPAYLKAPSVKASPHSFTSKLYLKALPHSFASNTPSVKAFTSKRLPSKRIPPAGRFRLRFFFRSDSSKSKADKACRSL